MPHDARRRSQAVTARRTQALPLPSLPLAAAERAAALAALAADIVRWCGPATALALASWLDEVAAEVAGHVGPS